MSLHFPDRMQAVTLMAPADWTVIGLYAVGMLSVGWYYSRSNETTDDYLLGGRNMRPWAVGLSLFATLLSTLSFLSYPGEVIRYGPLVLAQTFSYPFIYVVVGWWMIPFIMKLRVTSAYEILELRFGLGIRLFGSMLFLLLRLLWMALIIYVTASTVLIPLLGWEQSQTPILCAVLAVVTIVYTSLGGLRAVVVTDVVQTVILFGGALLTVLLITVHFGGVAPWWPDAWLSHWPEPVWRLDTSVRMSLPGVIISTFTWHVFTSGSDQMAIQRYLATRDVSAARRVLLVSLVANTLVGILLGLLGVALLAFYMDPSQSLPTGFSATENADSIFPYYIVSQLPQGVAGLVVAGLLAAAMSSLSSGVNSSSSVVTVDFIDRFRRGQLSDRDHVRLARWVSVAIGLAVIALSYLVGLVPGNIVERCYKTVNLLVAPLFLLFFMAMFVRRATTFGTWIGGIVSLTIAVLISFWETFFPESTPISFLWIMPDSFLAGAVTGTLASLLPIGRPPTAIEAMVADP